MLRSLGAPIVIEIQYDIQYLGSSEITQRYILWWFDSLKMPAYCYDTGRTHAIGPTKVVVMTVCNDITKRTILLSKDHWWTRLPCARVESTRPGTVEAGRVTGLVSSVMGEPVAIPYWEAATLRLTTYKGPSGPPNS